MLVRIDAVADAIYLELTHREIESSEEVSEGIIIDYDRNGHIVGVEILDASKKTGDAMTLRQFNLEMPVPCAEVNVTP
ncbi:MAG: DUF2283 domain-containing protein [Candidatus Schekmanbacteria bacterium]|nr:DUF2283 domain-containing protein [Candidatus Schekmanbacteria bacterium]